MTRRIEFELEVPGTPEQVWDAIGTGPGISSWFVPAEIEGDRMLQHHGPGFETEATVTAADRPRRFAYESAYQPGPDADEATIATEFLIAAKSGGTCVLRLVQSGFGSGPAWDKAVESFSSGWPGALDDLRLYLTHFPGRHAAGFATARLVDIPRQEAWAEMLQALGLPGEPAAGDRLESSQGPRLAGTVTRLEETYMSLLIEEPAFGFGFLGSGGPTDAVNLFVRLRLFGDDAQELAAAAEGEWKDWLSSLPATAPHAA
jgi:uncharacterized protein YndB with AHSA1/START domain